MFRSPRPPSSRITQPARVGPPVPVIRHVVPRSWTDSSSEDTRQKKRRKQGRYPMLEAGQKAPSLKLATDVGSTVDLAALAGHPTIVYFYPKDDTSGCTAQAKAFSDHRQAFNAIEVSIIGISPDSVASHKKFRAKHDLTVQLAADEDKAAATAWGVWVEKSMYGRKYMGVERTTMLIDAKGQVAKVWPKVKVPGHAGEVLAAVRTLKGSKTKG